MERRRRREEVVDRRTGSLIQWAAPSTAASRGSRREYSCQLRSVGSHLDVVIFIVAGEAYAASESPMIRPKGFRPERVDFLERRSSGQLLGVMGGSFPA